MLMITYHPGLQLPIIPNHELGGHRGCPRRGRMEPQTVATPDGSLASFLTGLLSVPNW